MTQAPIWHDGTIDLAIINQLSVGSMNAHLGIEFVEFGPDWLRARMPVDPRTRQPFGRLHGGASVALAETVASVAAMATLDLQRETAVGMEINANHVRPASDGFVFAVARPEARLRSTQIWSIRITDPADRLLCISRLTLAIIPAARAAPV